MLNQSLIQTTDNIQLNGTLNLNFESVPLDGTVLTLFTSDSNITGQFSKINVHINNASQCVVIFPQQIVTQNSFQIKLNVYNCSVVIASNGTLSISVPIDVDQFSQEGTLIINIGPTSNNNNSQQVLISVNGDVNLAGTLVINVTNWNQVPTNFHNFSVVDFRRILKFQRFTTNIKC